MIWWQVDSMCVCLYVCVAYEETCQLKLTWLIDWFIHYSNFLTITNMFYILTNFSPGPSSFFVLECHKMGCDWLIALASWSTPAFPLRWLLTCGKQCVYPPQLCPRSLFYKPWWCLHRQMHTTQSNEVYFDR